MGSTSNVVGPTPGSDASFGKGASEHDPPAVPSSLWPWVNSQASFTMYATSPRSSVTLRSRRKPILSRTRKDGAFQLPTVAHSRHLPVAKAAAATASAASVAHPCPWKRWSSS